MLCSTCISSIVASEFLPIVTGLVSYHSIKQNKAKQHTFRSLDTYREGNALQNLSSLHCKGTNLKCIGNFFLLNQQAYLKETSYGHFQYALFFNYQLTKKFSSNILNQEF